jgi:uncharacterized membrane protein
MKKWIFPALSVITAALISIISYERLPERMAVHFSASEMADNWMNKPFATFLLPATIVFITLIVLFSTRFEKDENKRRRMEATIGSVVAIVSATLLAVHIFVIAYNLGYEVSVAVTATLIVGFVFILIGNLLPRLPQGSMQWPKLPEPTQRNFSRFLGRLMMIVGFVFVLLFLLPTSYIFPIFFSFLMIFIIILIGSTIRFMRSQ